MQTKQPPKTYQPTMKKQDLRDDSDEVDLSDLEQALGESSVEV